MGDFLLCFSLRERVWSYRRSAGRRLAFVDPLASPSRRSRAGGAGCWCQPPPPVPRLHEGLYAHLPACPGAASWVSGDSFLQLPKVIRLVLTQMGLEAITPATGGRGSPRCSRGMVTRSWRLPGGIHLFSRPRCTWKGPTNTRWVSPGEPGSN